MEKDCKNCKFGYVKHYEMPCFDCFNGEYFKPKNEVAVSFADSVNHPAHYGREDAMECIDEMLLIFGVEAVKHFCLLNVWKYRYRAADKNGEEDLKKSDWYLKKFADLCGVDE